MAACRESQLTVNWCGVRTEVVDISDWTNGRDSDQNQISSQEIKTIRADPVVDPYSNYQKRSNIVQAIIHHASLEHLGGILGCGWDVNEMLRIPGLDLKYPTIRYHRYRTALGEASRQNWTEGVKMLLDAGAQCMTSDKLENPLTLALDNRDCPPDLIELLLQGGSDPNALYIDNGFEHYPLTHAIKNSRHNQKVRIVQLLLEHGADLNVTSGYSFSKQCPLSAALDCQEFSSLIRRLIAFGADVNYRVHRGLPILHKMITPRDASHTFIEKLDLLFMHGLNLNIVHGGETALDCVVRNSGHSNTIRWLIRHGADTSTLKLTLLRHSLKSTTPQHHPTHDTPLILLQAGMRVSHGARTQLANMVTAISPMLHGHGTGWRDLSKVIEGVWDQLQVAENGELQRAPQNLSKYTYPKYFTQQMADLNEFSDVNLDVYPEVSVTEAMDTREQWRYILDDIRKILKFLSQTQSLQWYSRRCVRENLASLQPSVVKTLPIPAILKRYVLCHGI